MQLSRRLEENRNQGLLKFILCTYGIRRETTLQSCVQHEEGNGDYDHARAHDHAHDRAHDVHDYGDLLGPSLLISWNSSLLHVREIVD